MIKRDIDEKFKKISETRKVVLITGARQVGKSTFVKSIKENNREYVDLADWNLRTLANEDPLLFLQRYNGKLIIENVQYAPALLSYIKMEVDKSNEKGKYWLTGSQRFELMKNVSESLAGRISILEMSSLSLAEKKGFSSKLFNPEHIESNINLDINDVFKNIFEGGMPEYVAQNIDRNTFFEDYITTYLERDVRDLAQVGDLLKFKKFLVAVAARNGETLNYSSLSEDADIDANTAKRWIFVLEASDIIYLLQPYFTKKLNRAVKTPKIVFLDTGLCAYLCGWNSVETLMNASTSGHFLETFVISELIKNKRNNKETLNYGIYFYRDKDQKEIDLIIEKDDIIYPFEIKKTANPKLSMLNNFKILENKNFKIGNGGLLCFYPDTIPLSEKYSSYPISVIF